MKEPRPLQLKSLPRNAVGSTAAEMYETASRITKTWIEQYRGGRRPKWCFEPDSDVATSAEILRSLAELVEAGLITVGGAIETTFVESSYHEYIRSPEWRARAGKAKERACGRCQTCNARGQLDAHHRTYERLGNEHDNDLIVLCRTCHQIFHEHGRLAK